LNWHRAGSGIISNVKPRKGAPIAHLARPQRLSKLMLAMAGG